MRHLEVLVFTENTTLPKILNWNVSTVNNVETAIEKLQQRPYKVVAISKDMPKTDQLKLRRLTSLLFDTVILVEYTNDSMLADTVTRAYWSRNKPNTERNYLDNSFEMRLANSISLN